MGGPDRGGICGRGHRSLRQARAAGGGRTIHCVWSRDGGEVDVRYGLKPRGNLLRVIAVLSEDVALAIGAGLIWGFLICAAAISGSNLSIILMLLDLFVHCSMYHLLSHCRLSLRPTC